MHNKASSSKPKNGFPFAIPVISILVIICAVIVLNHASNKKDKNSNETTMSSNESITSDNEHSSQMSTTTSLNSYSINTVSENIYRN